MSIRQQNEINLLKEQMVSLKEVVVELHKKVNSLIPIMKKQKKSEEEAGIGVIEN